MARMAESRTSRIYDIWSRCYDGTFGRLIHKRQLQAVAELGAEPGQWVLDLGIGTGTSLEAYPEGVRVVGADLSAGMLVKAQQRLRASGRADMHLVQADALNPPFAEQAFDHVIGTHTVSVVSDPPRLMQWVARLVKPGGRVVVLNHFQSEMKPVGWLEKVVNPLCTRIGWRSDLPLAECLNGSELKLSHQYKLHPADIWRIVVLTRT